MTLNIELRLPEKYLNALQQHVAARGESIDSYVSDLVADSLQVEADLSLRKATRHGTFAEWLQAWAERHPRLDHEIDITRESNYAGCGE